MPATASGWLGRAFALRDAGDPGTLDAIDQGLRRTTAGDPMASELLALRIGVLLSNGQHAEALSAADAYLASGAAPRRDEVEKIAAAIRAGRLDLSAP